MSEDWYVVGTLDDGDTLDDEHVPRGVLGPWSKQEAEKKAEHLGKLHPRRQFQAQNAEQLDERWLVPKSRPPL